MVHAAKCFIHSFYETVIPYFVHRKQNGLHFQDRTCTFPVGLTLLYLDVFMFYV